MATPTPSLKPFAAWVTGLTDNYRFNPFTRTRVHIIALHIVSVLIEIAIFWFAIEYIQNQTVHSISQHIEDAARIVRESIISGMPLSTSTLTGDLPIDIEGVRNMTFTYVFLGLILISFVFSYLLADVALRPARDSLRFQKRFIGNVAHEVRTPLAIMKTNTEVALMDPHLSPANRAVFEETVVELNRISETINNLLSFNTLIRPEQLAREPVDLGEIAYTVLTRHKEFAESRGIELKTTVFDMPASERMALGNPVALEQVATNLVKNALNYTPAHEGGSVEIRVAPDTFENRVALTVSDTGMGIADKDLFHIFEPFYRADTSRAREIGTGSSGLGLAIVNEIVRLHHGTITVRSALGRGTSIKVSIPRATPATESPESPSDEEGVHEVSLDFS